VSILELPYGDPNKVMLILLPKPGVSSDNLGDQVTSDPFWNKNNSTV
jgi:hypothetical protein